jgi:ArsR family metal-binding transcriptional regulator
MLAVLVGLTFGAIELRQIRNAQEAAAVVQLFETVQTEAYTKGATGVGPSRWTVVD